MRLAFLRMVALSVMVWSAFARAQTPPVTAAITEGPGIKAGDRAVFHLGINTDLRYDSNVFYQDQNTTGAFALRLSPNLEIATRGAPRGGDRPHMLDFRFYAGMDYTEWLTADPNVSRHRLFGVAAGAGLVILPGYPVTITLSDNYVRTSQPPYSSGNPNIDRDSNTLGIDFAIKPGGGRLQLNVGYAFGLDYYEASQYQALNRFTHRTQLRLMWKFFPKTAVFIDATATPTQYFQPGSLHPDSYPLRIVAGIVGLITPKLNIRLWAGYGNGFYQAKPGAGMMPGFDPNANPNTGVAGIDLGWRPTIFSSGVLGYKHDFADSLIGSFFDLDSVYIGWTQIIWRFIANVKLQYSNLRFQGIDTRITGLVSPDRSDHLIQFGARIDYQFKNFLALGIGYDLTYNNTNAVLDNSSPAMPANLVPLNYVKNEVWLRLTVKY
jgi:hypothetical protein